MVKKIGLIINPIAGIGGRAGLKGSDSKQIVQQALRMGIKPEANKRAHMALIRITSLCKDQIQLIAAPNEMGEDQCKSNNLKTKVVGEIKHGKTTAADTEKIARQMVDFGIDLLLFVGGDGTARNIYNALGDNLAVLGIPAGVKMHSAVFATNSISAADLACKYLSRGTRTIKAEVMDADEDAFRQGRINVKLFGYLQVPYDSNLIQGAKVGGIVSEEASLTGIANDIVERMDQEEKYVYILGPGTTTKAIKDRLGIVGTLLGVDVFYKDRLIGTDVNELDLKKLVQKLPSKIIVSPIGGQGFLFGRGNQQISHEVLKQVGKNNIIVVSTIEKLTSFTKSYLLVDTGSEETDNMLAGRIRVITGYKREHVFQVSNGLS